MDMGAAKVAPVVPESGYGVSNDDGIDVGSQHRGGCTAPFHWDGLTSNDCRGNGYYNGDMGGGCTGQQSLGRRQHLVRQQLEPTAAALWVAAF